MICVYQYVLTYGRVDAYLNEAGPCERPNGGSTGSSGFSSQLRAAGAVGVGGLWGDSGTKDPVWTGTRNRVSA